MSYFELATRDDDSTTKAIVVHDPHRSGIRLSMGRLYVSMTVAEAADVLKAMSEAIAELDRAAVGGPKRKTGVHSSWLVGWWVR